MSYQKTIDYLYKRLPLFSRIGSAAYKKDLNNIRILCESLGNPHKKFKSIHIAGTNGKGSVSHMLAATFQTAGYKTGLYTSPHLYDFRERIRLNGEMVNKNFVVDFTKRIRPLIEELEPSFFEITVAMAFEYFAEQQVDVAIVEVGLGGRLDSTNIITPELSVITNIGWDHMNMLGDTLDKIAFEKAGIIKKEIPVVVGETLPETKPVFEELATEKHAELIFAEEQFAATNYQWNGHLLQISFRDKNGTTVSIDTDLAGLYQVKNIAAVLTAVQMLETKFPGLNASVSDALKKVKELTGLSGRWEVLRQHPRLVLEVAHNKDGIGAMLTQLSQMNYDRLHFVVGMVKDKDVNEILKLFPAEGYYYFSQAHIPRALPASELQQKAAAFHLKGEAFENVNDAAAAALKAAGKNDIIIVCGSIFLVAEVDRGSIAQFS